jgi:peptide/nickel transport system substrate-binding protein
MESWYAGKDGANIAQKSNQWQGQNYIRYNNPEYDKRYEQAKTEVDAEKLAQLFIEMNDLVINDHVTIPLVRVGSKAGVSATLNVDNIADGAFTYDYWNIANWNRKQGS